MKLWNLHLEAFNPSKFMGQATAIGERESLNPEEVMDIAAKADPTEHKEYTRWILARWKEQNIRLPEDGSRVKQALTAFHKFKKSNKISEKDIYKYKTMLQLEKTVEPIMGTGSKRSREFQVNPLSLNGVWVFAKDERGYILAVQDAESLAKLGLGTKWCTREDYPECMAEDYLSDYDVIFIYAEGNKPLIQFTPDFEQVMDVHDEPVTDAPPLILNLALKRLRDPNLMSQDHGGLVEFVYRNLGISALEDYDAQVREAIRDIANLSRTTTAHSYSEVAEKWKHITRYLGIWGHDGKQWPGFREFLWPLMRDLLRDGVKSDLVAAACLLGTRERLPADIEYDTLLVAYRYSPGASEDYVQAMRFSASELVEMASRVAKYDSMDDMPDKALLELMIIVVNIKRLEKSPAQLAEVAGNIRHLIATKHKNVLYTGRMPVSDMLKNYISSVVERAAFPKQLLMGES